MEKIGRGGRIRTHECEDQNLVPYRLATPLHTRRIQKYGGPKILSQPQAQSQLSLLLQPQIE